MERFEIDDKRSEKLARIEYTAYVFVNSDGKFKMGDLNVSKVAKENGLLFTQTGTPYYASPEVWRD